MSCVYEQRHCHINNNGVEPRHNNSLGFVKEVDFNNEVRSVLTNNHATDKIVCYRKRRIRSMQDDTGRAQIAICRMQQDDDTNGEI